MTTPFHHPDSCPSRAERKAREELPCVSDSLSSINRPYSLSPPSTTSHAPVDFFLPPLSPHVRLLHLIVPFIPSFEFAFRLPFLSHSYQHLYTDEQLHQQEAKRRFAMSSVQWEEFSITPYLQLRVPVHKFAYYQADHEDDGQWYEWTADKPSRAWGGDTPDIDIEGSDEEDEQSKEEETQLKDEGMDEGMTDEGKDEAEEGEEKTEENKEEKCNRKEEEEEEEKGEKEIKVHHPSNARLMASSRGTSTRGVD
jgi:hypothetical protein